MDLFTSCDFYFSNFGFLVNFTWIFGWIWLIYLILGKFFWKRKKKKVLIMTICKWFKFTVLRNTFIGCFIIFLGCKIWGLIPYVFGLTTQMVITFLVSIILWFLIIFSSLSYSISKFFAHLVPFGSPIILVPFLFRIEVLSQFLRPLALSLRLAIKMTTGHVFIGLLAIGIQNVFFKFSFFFFFLTFILFFYLLFELMICLIQSFVFSLLLRVWSLE